MATKVLPKQSTMGNTHAKPEKKDVITLVMVPTHVGHSNMAKHYSCAHAQTRTHISFAHAQTSATMHLNHHALTWSYKYKS